MARHTGGGRNVVVVVDVAVEANPRRISVRVRQREAKGAVVKRRRLPSAGAVALLTSLCEAPNNMVWVLRTLVIRQMAAHAGCRSEVVIIVDVAVQADARRIGVRIGQREAGAGVVEFGVQPGVRAVALLAIR